MKTGTIGTLVMLALFTVGTCLGMTNPVYASHNKTPKVMHPGGEKKGQPAPRGNAVSRENVRSQAEKRLERQRKDLLRNWGG